MDTIVWNTEPSSLKLYAFTLKNIYHGLWPDVAWANQNQLFVVCSCASAKLAWPLPAGMSERELDARLYGNASTVPVVLTESTVMSEVPVVKKRPRRPNASQLSN